MADQPSQLRILLADEQSLFREAVRVVLESEADLVVVAEARDGLQAVAEAERTTPDIALLDVNLPNCNGVRATTLIKERVPDCRVLVLAGEERTAEGSPPWARDIAPRPCIRLDRLGSGP